MALCACNSCAMTAAMSTPEGAEAIVRNYFSSFETADPQQIAQFVSEDFVNDHTAALGSGCVGRLAYLERLPGFLADMVDLRYEIEHIVCAENDVAVFYQMTARWRGEHSFEIRGAQRLTVQDGEISHRVDYWDSASFLVQVDEEAASVLANFGIA